MKEGIDVSASKKLIREKLKENFTPEGIKNAVKKGERESAETAAQKKAETYQAQMAQLKKECPDLEKVVLVSSDLTFLQGNQLGLEDLEKIEKENVEALRRSWYVFLKKKDYIGASVDIEVKSLDTVELKRKSVSLREDADECTERLQTFKNKSWLAKKLSGISEATLEQELEFVKQATKANNTALDNLEALEKKLTNAVEIAYPLSAKEKLAKEGTAKNGIKLQDFTSMIKNVLDHLAELKKKYPNHEELVRRYNDARRAL
jgi:hypothetical protein